MKSLKLVFLEEGLSEWELNRISGGNVSCPSLQECGVYKGTSGSGGDCPVLAQCGKNSTVVVNPCPNLIGSGGTSGFGMTGIITE